MLFTRIMVGNKRLVTNLRLGTVAFVCIFTVDSTQFDLAASEEMIHYRARQWQLAQRAESNE